MKKMIFTAVFLMSSMSFAVAPCPADSKTITTCLSTPKPNDNELISGVFDSIAVCENATETILVSEKDGKVESEVAQVDVKMGGTSYLVENEETAITFSITTGTPGKTAPARLLVHLKFANLKAHSSYTCEK